MRRTIATAAVAALSWATASSASAQQALTLDFNDGRVRLIADNVPVSQILAEWSRRGGTQIVNGERVPGPPITLQLVDVPEQQALDIVLRGAAGYMVSAREVPAPGASSFDKVLVLPTTARAPAAAAAQPPPPPAPQFELPETDDIPQVEDPQPEPAFPEQEPQGLRGVPGFQRGRPGGINVPTTGPNTQPEDVPDPDVASPAPTPSNPFGIPPGSTRPGVINPPPQQQNPDAPPRER